jgi:hypothetical protein
MTRGVLPIARGGVAGRFGSVLLLCAALLASAPFAAALAARAVAGGGAGLTSIFVCFASGSTLPDADTGQSGPAAAHGNACVLCQTLCHGAAPFAGEPDSVVAAPIQSRLPLWMVADCAAPTPRPRFAHQPRAPPAASLS